MRYVRYIIMAGLLLVTSMASAKGSAKHTVYMFGFSASFNDSIVYFTNIQALDGYITNDRNHFLINRDQYSYQLRNYFENRGQLHRTCITIYATDKKAAEKKYQKLIEKYTVKSKNKFDVMYLTDNDFKYETVSADNGTVFVDPEEGERAAKRPDKKPGKHVTE